MDREEAIEILENGEWWDELAEWYMIVHPEHDKLHEAVDMAVAALREQEARRWISCRDQIPGKEQKVVFYNTGNEAVYAGKFNFIGARGAAWFRVGKVSYPGSHWVPLPEPPKEE